MLKFMILEYLPKSRRNMINSPGWQKPETKPFLHQISLDQIKKLVDRIEQFNKGDISADTYVELSFKADLLFHQKLIRFRSVHFIIRRKIQKI